MAEEELLKWSSFFDKAGVPRGPSSEYATLFCNHRIKENLLGDLTKDILNDIGITVMGDIMSILKHAKAVHAKLEREKLSNQMSAGMAEDRTRNSPVKLQNKKVTTPLLSPPTAGVSVKPNIKPPKKINDEIKKETSPVLPKKRPLTSALSLSDRFTSEKSSPAKQSRESTPKTANNSPKKMLDEQKAKKQIQDAKRQSAFERLDKHSNNSERNSDAAKIKISKPTSKILPPLIKSDHSVFNRLGGAEASSNTKLIPIKITTGSGSRVVSGNRKESNTPVVMQPVKPTSAVKPVKPVKPVSKIIKLTSSKPKPEKEKKSVFSRLGPT